MMHDDSVSRRAIFDALCSASSRTFPKPDLSDLEKTAISYENPLGTFKEAIRTSGGAVVEAGLIEAAEDSFTVKGEFGVAENGAIWIETLPEGVTRRDLFIHERLVIELSESEIVSNMHEAYARLGEEARGYGIFISGPSKTADIEQALVFGVHGPRELVVVLH